jgi:hypothetical protein
VQASVFAEEVGGWREKLLEYMVGYCSGGAVPCSVLVLCRPGQQEAQLAHAAGRKQQAVAQGKRTRRRVVTGLARSPVRIHCGWLCPRCFERTQFW